MVTKTQQCPHCKRAIEVETQEYDCETGKRLRIKVECLLSERRAIISELNYAKLEAKRFCEDLVEYRSENTRLKAEVARLNAVAERARAVGSALAAETESALRPWWKRLLGLA